MQTCYQNDNELPSRTRNKQEKRHQPNNIALSSRIATVTITTTRQSVHDVHDVWCKVVYAWCMRQNRLSTRTSRTAPFWPDHKLKKKIYPLCDKTDSLQKPQSQHFAGHFCSQQCQRKQQQLPLRTFFAMRL
eukprot:scpid93933/ scgid27783/ 